METIKAQSLFQLIQLILDDGTVRGFAIPQCLTDFPEVYHCFNAANLAKYLKAPMFIIESPYDQYSVDNIVVALCKSNK